MTFTNQRRFDAPALASEHLILTAESYQMAIQIADRLDQRVFRHRGNTTRREDGEIVLSNSNEETNSKTMSIRLNSFVTGNNAVINLRLDGENVAAMSLIIRDSSRFGGDDRSGFITPKSPSKEDLTIIQNILFSAATCLGRGEVHVAENSGNGLVSAVKYGLFLPSCSPMPSFDAEFCVVGLKSQY
jgi:hypothetical protein